MESGREYRHTREQIKRSRDQANRDGDLRAVRDARHSYRNYTDHITNVASRRVVDLAVEHSPATIQLEDLTHYRENATDAIHDWPYAEIQDKIAYKATAEGIPVATVDPAGTSSTCRKCGADNPRARDGHDFQCLDCGYQVHADVNAAINIAER
jgi:IS605 OrfB family transposase